MPLSARIVYSSCHPFVGVSYCSVESGRPMPTNDARDSPFQVGQRYENRKGIYEVTSICGDDLEIRSDSGGVIRTSAALQTRILRNMEKEMADAAARKRGTSPKSFGEFFRGLSHSDFSNDVTGTHWRSREQLGGAVSRILDVNEPFNSWSIYGRPEVHWGSTNRYRLNHASLQTKFFAKINPKGILFGLYVERSDKRTDNQDDWIRFFSWCEDDRNLEWLHNVMRRTNAIITNPYEEWSDLSFYGTMTPTSSGYIWSRPAEPDLEFAADQLANVLAELSTKHWLNLVLGRAIGKRDAIAEGEKVAATIAEMFNILLPVYRSSSVL